MQNQEMKVLSVSLSPERGRKYYRESIQIAEAGVVDDAHYGSDIRQVSLLGQNRVDELMSLTGCSNFDAGAFAENILCSYLDDLQVQPLDVFKIGEVELEVTAVGKPMHKEVNLVGHYITPHFGVFCRVIKTGEIKADDSIEWKPRIFRAKVITLSDRASAGIYQDKSGPIIVDALEEFSENENLRFSVDLKLIPDDADQLKEIVVNTGADVIICTGGTGISNSDITPDVIKPLLDMEIPGIMEYVRMKSAQENPNAVLSRSIAGVRGQALVYCLPGSPRAVSDYMKYILDSLKHALWMLNDLKH